MFNKNKADIRFAEDPAQALRLYNERGGLGHFNGGAAAKMRQILHDHLDPEAEHKYRGDDNHRQQAQGGSWLQGAGIGLGPV